MGFLNFESAFLTPLLMVKRPLVWFKGLKCVKHPSGLRIFLCLCMFIALILGSEDSLNKQIVRGLYSSLDDQTKFINFTVKPESPCSNSINTEECSTTASDSDSTLDSDSAFDSDIDVPSYESYSCNISNFNDSFNKNKHSGQESKGSMESTHVGKTNLAVSNVAESKEKDSSSDSGESVTSGENISDMKKKRFGKESSRAPRKRKIIRKELGKSVNRNVKIKFFLKNPPNKKSRTSLDTEEPSNILNYSKVQVEQNNEFGKIDVNYGHGDDSSIVGVKEKKIDGSNDDEKNDEIDEKQKTIDCYKNDEKKGNAGWSSGGGGSLVNNNSKGDGIKTPHRTNTNNTGKEEHKSSKFKIVIIWFASFGGVLVVCGAITTFIFRVKISTFVSGIKTSASIKPYGVETVPVHPPKLININLVRRPSVQMINYL